MLFADASVCTKTGAAGWGAWVKRDGGASEVFGEAFKSKMNGSNAAEACALANALHRALAWRLIEAGDVVMLQSDSAATLARVRRYCGAADNPAPKGIRTGLSRRAPDKPSLGALKVISKLAEGARLTLVVRHVKGHSGEQDGRSWVNRECDRTAKQHMRTKRLVLAAATAAAQQDGIAA